MIIPSVACGIADVSTDARVTYESARLEANAAQRCRRDAFNHTKIVMTVTTPRDETTSQWWLANYC